MRTAASCDHDARGGAARLSARRHTMVLTHRAAAKPWHRAHTRGGSHAHRTTDMRSHGRAGQRLRRWHEERLAELTGSFIEESRQLVLNISIEELCELEEHQALSRLVGRLSWRKQGLAWVLWLGCN